MLKRVFITVLTYPTPSHKYIETVCTAGITADGEWIRIYPIQLRLLNATRKETARIRKYCWYTFNLEPRTRDKDMRKESISVFHYQQHVKGMLIQEMVGRNENRFV